MPSSFKCLIVLASLSVATCPYDQMIEVMHKMTVNKNKENYECNNQMS